MKLLRIRPTYFRGFGPSEWHDLDANLVVLYGANGHGKTSLAEAIEWLLYGMTRRRERGEALSQRDYQGSYRNAHAPAEERTSVEAVFRQADGSTVTLRRDLIIGARNIESSMTYIDGARADFQDHISLDQLYNPVISQDALQQFIHCRPIDRRNWISEAFGLQPLSRFKSTLDSARTRLQNNRPQQVIAASRRLGEVTRAMSHHPDLRDMAIRWTNGTFDLTGDLSELISASAALLSAEPLRRPIMLGILNEARQEASARVFGRDPIIVPSDLGTTIATLESRAATIEALTDPLAEAFQVFTTSPAPNITTQQLSFWQTGLELATPATSDRCPMCEAQTLTPAKRAEIQQHINSNANHGTQLSNIQEQGRTLAASVRRLDTAITRLFPTFLNEQQRTTLTALFADNAKPCTAFLDQHDAAARAADQTHTLLDQQVRSLESIATLATAPEGLPAVTELVGALSTNLEQTIRAAIRFATNYSDAYNAFAAPLGNRIAEAETVRQIDALITPLDAWNDIQVLQIFNEFLADLLTIVREIENHFQEKQTSLFTTRGQEINSWYDMMNPGARVRYTRMEPTTDALTFWANTFGQDINAVSCLSHCQLNCLGLSIHLMRVLTPDSPFKFLLIDDPVQAMDDDHCQAMLHHVLSDLLTRNHQVIIFSHVQGLVDSIHDIYYDRRPKRLRISQFQKTGPDITDAETLTDALRRTTEMSQGNEDYRRLALDTLLRCVELLVRDVCRQTDSPPPSFNARTKEMLPFFRGCPGTTPQQEQGLRATINFTGPARHTEVGWSVPTTSQITPHIDRIRQLVRTLNLPS